MTVSQLCSGPDTPSFETSVIVTYKFDKHLCRQPTIRYYHLYPTIVCCND